MQDSSRLIGLHLLLIATAIQGMTPDAHDLASTALVRLVCEESASTVSLLGDDAQLRPACERSLPHTPPAPQDEADSDGLPDEVCGPARSPMVASLFARMGWSRHFGLAWSEAWAPAAVSTDSNLSFPPDVATPGDALLRALCRLRC